MTPREAILFLSEEKHISSIVQQESMRAQIIEKSRLNFSKKLAKIAKRKAFRKRIVRVSLVTANLLLLVGVVVFIYVSSHRSASTNTATTLASAAQTAAPVNPVDRLTSYDVAANLASELKLEETVALTNQAQSAKVAVEMSASDSNIAPKPQVVATALKSWRDIQDYKVVTGDTLESIAQKFGVTSNSIKWSNSLAADTVAVGTSLVIPPVNGLVVTAKSGDTAQSLAAKYGANADQVSQYNDAEQTGVVAGRRVLIPDGKIIPAATSNSSFIRTGGAAAGTISFVPRYGGNGYDFGWCTWYAAMRSGAPGNWGNANTWGYYAARSGWTVSSAPRAGAIFQTGAGWAGHVGIVESVNADGTIVISDMNGRAGFGRVWTGTVSASSYEHYIYR